MPRRPHPGDPRHHREDIRKLQARVAELEAENNLAHYTLFMAGVELGDYGNPAADAKPCGR